MCVGGVLLPIRKSPNPHQWCLGIKSLTPHTTKGAQPKTSNLAVDAPDDGVVADHLTQHLHAHTATAETAADTAAETAVGRCC